MRETPISTCEKGFLLEALWEGKRIDGRSTLETRDLDIVYGLDWGSVQVTLGKTRVLAQASCQVVEPTFTRPNEGILIINVELTSLAAPRFEGMRNSDDGVELGRLLERTLKESRCVDLESLCIVAEEKVWEVRLDIHVLNHEGNMFDAASIAGLCSLCHFRRPDVTLKGDVVTIHPLSDRDPVPLGIQHHPVTTTYGLFEYPGGETLFVIDPSRIEEEAILGKMVLGVNGYREMCTLHLAGQVVVDKTLILRLANITAEKSKKMVDTIKESLRKDEASRQSKGPRGFAAKIRSDSLLHASVPRSNFDFTRVVPLARSVVNSVKVPDTSKTASAKSEDGVVHVASEDMEQDKDKDSGDSDGSDMDSEPDVQVTGVMTKKQILESKVTEKIDLVDSDSEEEETVILDKV
eukprot:TRINITY_DN1288_c0_g1_i1.p1 TRINITY_DN1288_c0_g1~~TRINITY_DN1288_c0_g1_i1.p1  ORF type:complete len:408 (+),score=92.95 TRINITY_DN1288_c0_g1_i1:43-1266(+)